jgi:hypothetical protein
LTICIIGEDPFGSFLDETVRGESVGSRALAVRRYGRVEELKSCHIVFVSRMEHGRLDEVLASLKGRSVLTVGEVEGFASRGGMIRFVTDRNRIRFRINLEAAKAANLTLSSKLLRPAQIVPTGKD